MRLIDADELINWIRQEPTDGMFTEEIVEAIGEQPTIEACPVVHGRWEDKPTGRYGKWQSWCSACGKHSGIGGIESNRHRNYCPNCGARMDGEQHG